METLETLEDCKRELGMVQSMCSTMRELWATELEQGLASCKENLVTRSWSGWSVVFIGLIFYYIGRLTQKWDMEEKARWEEELRKKWLDERR